LVVRQIQDSYKNNINDEEDVDEDIFNAGLSLNMHGYFFSNLNILNSLKKKGNVSSVIDEGVLSQVELEGKDFQLQNTEKLTRLKRLTVWFLYASSIVAL